MRGPRRARDRWQSAGRQGALHLAHDRLVTCDDTQVVPVRIRLVVDAFPRLRFAQRRAQVEQRDAGSACRGDEAIVR
jgi:hypothetical protein